MMRKLSTTNKTKNLPSEARQTQKIGVKSNAGEVHYLTTAAQYNERKKKKNIVVSSRKKDQTSGQTA